MSYRNIERSTEICGVQLGCRWSQRGWRHWDGMLRVGRHYIVITQSLADHEVSHWDIALRARFGRTEEAG